ncbi:ABC transporter ATP-binding protein [Treponema brennaborense]|uniref:ABC transporter related protein n=1 Tax=Treponema brennaborense (strain DSM 12168 / CIP 105900 / DD5/3) TaxID=906968 RepID=F4LQ87_TREBD|nr:ABC transporter ATP-binding protein [Treponema brennaborense]AEE16108.1 ABC transporter related protein [Treponema brennaborense DSM 12168]
MNDQYIVRIENLEKKYTRKRALNGVTISLEKGKILGLMGPNGSGKTTLLKILAGLRKPSGGTVTIGGKPLGTETKAMVSFLPDRNILYRWMSAEDAIRFYADYFRDFDTEKAFDMLSFMNLERHEKIQTMSKGMVEKMNLTLVFSRNAKLYLLDEPLGGVDPVARDRIVSAIVKTYSENSSIIVSTHLVNDVENMFDDVCFIHEGTCLLQGSAESLRAERKMSINQLYVQLFQDK